MESSELFKVVKKILRIHPNNSHLKKRDWVPGATFYGVGVWEYYPATRRYWHTVLPPIYFYPTVPANKRYLYGRKTVPELFPGKVWA